MMMTRSPTYYVGLCFAQDWWINQQNHNENEFEPGMKTLNNNPILTNLLSKKNDNTKRFLAEILR